MIGAMILSLVLKLVFWPIMAVAALVVAARAATRYARAIEQRAGDRNALVELQERVGQLEEALDDARAQIARLEAAQEFTTRLLTDRAGAAQV